MGNTEESGERTVATNRKARHEFQILETVEAGLVLKGTEVKSLRQGNASLVEGYASIKGGEAWIFGVHISPYKQGNIENPDPVRPRKLLLHRKELRKLIMQTGEKGLTLIPLKLYFRNGVAKILLGLARGKKMHDKRRDIASREARRAIRQRLSRQG